MSQATERRPDSLPAAPRAGRRQLAAIVFADMVGYSALMDRDELHAMRLRARYRESVAAEIERSGGEVVQHYGDGALLLFPSAVAAAESARRLQVALRQEPRVPVRIGVHLADVVRDEEGVYGTGVNVAARVQALCPPGGVLVSGAVSQELQNQAGVEVVCIGYYRIKNIDPPLKICALADPALEIPRPAEIDAPLVPWKEPPRTGEALLVEAGRGWRLRARLSAFYGELRRRRVDRVMTAYLTAAATSLGLMHEAAPTLGLPEGLVGAALAGALLGAPVAAVLAWIFDVDVRVTREVLGGGARSKETARQA